MFHINILQCIKTIKVNDRKIIDNHRYKHAFFLHRDSVILNNILIQYMLQHVMRNKEL